MRLLPYCISAICMLFHLVYSNYDTIFSGDFSWFLYAFHPYCMVASGLATIGVIVLMVTILIRDIRDIIAQQKIKIIYTLDVLLLCYCFVYLIFYLKFMSVQ